MRTSTILKQAEFAKNGETFSEVKLPHTWNAFDGQDGGNDYWRGLAHYRIKLPNPQTGAKQFIRFEGANHIARVSCNGTFLGEHKGGFSTFVYELTDVLTSEGNELTVDVTNEVCDVYPQMADFTFYGGIYRNVTFIEIGKSHFDFSKCGTDGLFVTPYSTGKTRFDIFTVDAEEHQVWVAIKDADGNIVKETKVAAKDHTIVALDVREPHLWNGMKDSYCYTAEVCLEKNGLVVDKVSTLFGYRSFRVDAENGFYLNGVSCPLRGVSKHQDMQDKGWAVDREDLERDIEILKEIGANTLRLAHYQHDQYFYDLCDKTGFAIWAEIPFISGFRPGKDAYDNTMSQMKELVVQNYNHPSVFFWGISNEITLCGDSEELLTNLRDLHTLCKTLDPSRLTTMAEVSTVLMNSEHCHITDVLSYNHYFGWYCGTVADNGPWFDTFHAMHPDRAVGCSEYGADAVLDWHTTKPMNHDYTEEYEAFYHHEMLKMIETRPYLWSTHVWNMFDFAADARDEGGSVGKNNKGLVSYDRKIRKEAFYIYQAYWSDVPMVHVCGERFKDRAPEEREVIVYTNCPKVTLYVNGEAIEEKIVEHHAAVFENVPLKEGDNVVTASYEDVCSNEVILCPIDEPNPAYVLPRGENDVPVGNWFDGVAEGTDDDHMEFPEGYYSVKDSVADVMQIEDGKLLIELLANVGAFGPIVAVKSMKNSPAPLIDFIPGVGNLPAGGMAYINKRLNEIKK